MEKINHIFNTLINLIGEMAPYILLGFIIAGIMHSFISTTVFTRHLSGKGWKSVLKAALVGVPLPLCSCGVLPTAISLRRSGASRASTTSFLVATPQTGVDSIAATWSLLGPAFAVIRPVSAFATALMAGGAVGYSERPDEINHNSSEDVKSSLSDRPKDIFKKSISALRYGCIDLVDSIGSWLVIGLIIAALITVFVPADFFASLAEYPILAMLAVVVIAVPMYVCATGSIPIALSLMLKGLSPGTALVLLMAGPAANFASFTLISRELGKKAALIYLIAIVICSILFGLLIDFLLPRNWSMPHGNAEMHCHAAHLNTLEIICSVILTALLISSFVRRKITDKIKNKKMEKNMEKATTYKITGMNCPHCQSTVTNTLKNIAGVLEVSVNLSSGMAQVTGEHDYKEAIDGVTKQGFGIELA
ncbi:MAG: SO_0444 family Cu/Zn efflux transporter [Paramuribaculum sp.]|nr:SO_0444 family Cu/Zn efflux transporter [Paramuribaculum sp.]